MNKFTTILLVVIFSFFSTELYSSIDTTLNKNVLFTNFTKLINIYNLSSSFNYSFDTDYGVLELNNLYQGNILQSTTSTVRDDELQNLKYTYPLNENYGLIFNQYYTYSSDSRSIGANQLQRLSGLAGFTYRNDYFNSRILGGFESNEQIGVPSNATIYLGNIKTKAIDLEGYKLRGEIDAEILNLNFDRNNTRFRVNTNAFRQFNNQDILRADLNYRRHDRAYFSINDPNIDLYNQVEERLEERYGVNLGLKYGLVGESVLDLDLNLSTMDVIKENRSLTYDRLYEEINFGLNAQINAGLFYGDWLFGSNYSNRSETNLVEDRINTLESELSALRQLENQKDNTSDRFKLFALGNYRISSNQSISINYSTSILRYDTPSDLNNDDRDQLTINTDLVYSNSISKYLTFSLKGSLRLMHLVFLKSERSYLNNWNRIISLSPEMTYETKNFKMRPKFRVMANYTVYDYEEFSSGIRSLSFRTISYRDSINLNINKNFGIYSKVFFRYIETGTLFWNDFAEIPQSSDLENQIKLLLEIKRENLIVFGFGIRYYIKKITALDDNFSALQNFELNSVGPETRIIYNLKNGSNISLSGWYEYQLINNSERNQIPNIFLTSNIKL